MLEIKPIEEKTEQERLCNSCGIRYDETMFAYRAYNDGALLGVAQFDIGGSTARIDAMRQVLGSEEDWEGMFILGRAVLNFLDLCGVTEAVYDPKDAYERRIAKMIGFRGDKGLLHATLTGMFDGKCEGHRD